MSASAFSLGAGYRRDGTALAATGVVFAAALLLWPAPRKQPSLPAATASLAVTLAPPAPAPPPKLPDPTPPTLPLPAPAPAPDVPAFLPDIPALAPVPPPRQKAAPRRMAAQVAPPAPANAPAFDLPQSTATALPDVAAKAEDLYVAGLHAYLAARTSPPHSAAYALTHPSGTTDVGFDLARDGTLANLRVLRSSGSPMLDARALEIVRFGHYPPFPKDAYPGEASHAFHVPIAFRPSGAEE